MGHSLFRSQRCARTPVPGSSQQKRPRRAVRPPEPCARTVTAGFMGSDDSPSDLDAKCQTPRRVFVPNYVCNATFALLDRDQKGAMVLTASRVQCRPPSDLLLL